MSAPKKWTKAMSEQWHALLIKRCKRVITPPERKEYDRLTFWRRRLLLKFTPEQKRFFRNQRRRDNRMMKKIDAILFLAGAKHGRSTK